MCAMSILSLKDCLQVSSSVPSKGWRRRRTNCYIVHEVPGSRHIARRFPFCKSDPSHCVLWSFVWLWVNWSTWLWELFQTCLSDNLSFKTFICLYWATPQWLYWLLQVTVNRSSLIVVKEFVIFIHTYIYRNFNELWYTFKIVFCELIFSIFLKWFFCKV